MRNFSSKNLVFCYILQSVKLIFLYAVVKLNILYNERKTSFITSKNWVLQTVIFVTSKVQLLLTSETSGWFCTAWKVSIYGFFSDPYFPVFGLNTEIYTFHAVLLRVTSRVTATKTKQYLQQINFAPSIEFCKN